jgi:hypothetical protein
LVDTEFAHVENIARSDGYFQIAHVPVLAVVGLEISARGEGVVSYERSRPRMQALGHS